MTLFFQAMPERRFNSKVVDVMAFLAFTMAGLALVSLFQGKNSILDESEENDFDSEPGSMDAHWDLEELRHRLVQTQRKLTSQDKDYENKVARLDADVDDLMNLFSKRPPGILIHFFSLF